MNALKILGLGMIVAGVLGLVYGGFTYTKDSHEANLGPINVTVRDKESVNVPIWAGVIAVVAGGGLLLFGGRKT